MIRLALLTIGCPLAAASLAGGTCVSPPMESKAFSAAADTVRRLPELKAWSSTHPFPVAHGSIANPVVRNGRCHIPVGVSANRPEQLAMSFRSRNGVRSTNHAPAAVRPPTLRYLSGCGEPICRRTRLSTACGCRGRVNANVRPKNLCWTLKRG